MAGWPRYSEEKRKTSLIFKMQVKNFIKTNIKEIPLEEAHGGAGQRQILVNPENISSDNLDAITKGYLNVGSSFDWHSHNLDEVFIVLKGEGKFYCGDDVCKYEKDDVFTIPPDLNHKITAEGKESSEFYFIRIK